MRPRTLLLLVPVIVLAALGAWWMARLVETPANLSKEPTRRTEAPAVPAKPAPPKTVEPPAPAEPGLQKWLGADGEPPLPDREAVEAYLNRVGRKAEALLAAADILQDPSYLQEALEKYPKNPRVLLQALFEGDEAKREEWSAQFLKSDPRNALAHWQAAERLFKAGDIEGAMAQLAKGSGRPYRDYSMDRLLAIEELLRGSGMDARLANVVGMAQLKLQPIQLGRNVARELVKVREDFITAGDTEGAGQLGLLGLEMGTQMLDSESGRKLMIVKLVGMAVENIFLNTMPPESTVELLPGRTVQQRLDQLKQLKEEIRSSAGLAEQVYNLPPHEVSAYFDRVKLFGELEALRWLSRRLPPVQQEPGAN